MQADAAEGVGRTSKGIDSETGLPAGVSAARAGSGTGSASESQPVQADS